ncbi:MAG TPA: type II secretion system protein N [Allosphingosinicella sp.]|jgi:general secretion pathway protein N
MRIRLRWWREIFFLCALLFSLVALLPLRIALDRLGFAEKGLAAREAEGSLWLGTLTEARFGTIALGDVATRLRFLPLLVGRARLDLEQPDDGLRGSFTVSRHGFGIDDATGSFEAPELPNLPRPMLDLADFSFRFGDGLCAEAGGLVKARFTGDVAGMPLTASLSGQPRCDGQALLLPLASQTSADRLDIRIFADGRYRVDAALRLGEMPYSGRFDGSF